MRSTLLILLLVIGATSAAMAEGLTLAKGTAGHVQLGMTTAKVMSNFPKGSVRVTSTMLEGEAYKTLDICHKRPCTKADLLAELDGDDQVDRITVFSTHYQTAKGIGVGSTYQALQKAHTITRVSGGEMDAILAIVEPLGMSFAFPRSGPKGTIAPAAKIASVLIW